MTQALVWSIENGGTSQAKLKDVIKAVKNNTGKFTSSVDGLYTQILPVWKMEEKLQRGHA